MSKGSMRLMLIVILLTAVPAWADLSLQNWLVSVNGTNYEDTLVVPGLNAGGFNSTTGLGTLLLTYNPGAAGMYYLNMFFDHQVHVPFFYENGAVTIVPPAAGQTFEIGDPWFSDIKEHTRTNALNGNNGVPMGFENDVALATGFSFILAANEQALMRVTVTTTPPPLGVFHLMQSTPDPVDGVSGLEVDPIYLTASLTIRESQAPDIPEPSSYVLLGTALTLSGIAARRRAKGSN